MLPNPNLISCNFSSSSSSSSPSLLSKTLISRFPSQFLLPNSQHLLKASIFKIVSPNKSSLKPCNLSVTPAFSQFKKRWAVLQKFRTYVKIPSEKVTMEEGSPVEENNKLESEGNDGDGGGDWTTSILLFGLWAVLMFYVFKLTPNQTPSRDLYFLKKLINLNGNDGFKMNELISMIPSTLLHDSHSENSRLASLSEGSSTIQWKTHISLFSIAWIVIVICLSIAWALGFEDELSSGGNYRSARLDDISVMILILCSRGKFPVWPFLVLSCFGGAYVLLPYFVLWKPPPPPVDEAELGRWPLNFLESKLTARVLVAAGLGLITYASLAGGDVRTEFFQYFRESKFIHVMSLDFTLLSAFAPFWVYNDMTARKWLDKGSWILPLALIPFLGPALYIVLRPPVSAMPVSLPSTTTKQEIKTEFSIRIPDPNCMYEYRQPKSRVKYGNLVHLEIKKEFSNGGRTFVTSMKSIADQIYSSVTDQMVVIPLPKYPCESDFLNFGLPSTAI